MMQYLLLFLCLFQFSGKAYAQKSINWLPGVTLLMGLGALALEGKTVWKKFNKVKVVNDESGDILLTTAEKLPENQSIYSKKIINEEKKCKQMPFSFKDFYKNRIFNQYKIKLLVLGSTLTLCSIVHLATSDESDRSGLDIEVAKKEKMAVEKIREKEEAIKVKDAEIAACKEALSKRGIAKMTSDLEKNNQTLERKEIELSKLKREFEQIVNEKQELQSRFVTSEIKEKVQKAKEEEAERLKLEIEVQALREKEERSRIEAQVQRNDERKRKFDTLVAKLNIGRETAMTEDLFKEIQAQLTSLEMDTFYNSNKYLTKDQKTAWRELKKRLVPRTENKKSGNLVKVLADQRDQLKKTVLPKNQGPPTFMRAVDAFLEVVMQRRKVLIGENNDDDGEWD